MPSQLEQLSKYTRVVADTGDFNSYSELKSFIQDGTTNPSVRHFPFHDNLVFIAYRLQHPLRLIYAASQMPQYRPLVEDALSRIPSSLSLEARVQHALNELTVLFGVEILKLVPGRVSTEIDARLSFNTEATVAKALELVSKYEQYSIDVKARVYFKIAGTWEGIRAAEILTLQGYSCNITLIFGFCQAIRCAEAKTALISPFVGRILDYWKAQTGRTAYLASEDPGVLSVKSIYQYFKKYNISTIIMGASFRNKEEIIALCGCDYLTISPKLLQELASCNDPISVQLKVDDAQASNIEECSFNEGQFRWALNQDQCASFKLAEGIRLFALDTERLENSLRSHLQG